MDKIGPATLFNSPLEIGLRILFLFKNTKKYGLDMQRLVYYSYLLVHSSDVPDSPKSLHPNFPDRSCEILISRELISNGLKLLLSKGLICIDYNKSGIKYKKNDKTTKFLEYFESNYSKELDERSMWVCGKFDDLKDDKLNDFMQQNLGKWGSEFSRDYRIMGDDVA